MDFSDRIKSLREEKNMTHSEVAAVLKKSEGAVRSWEMKRSKPDADTLIKLAGFFDCTTDYLLGLSITKNEKEFNTQAHTFSRLNSVNVKSRGLLIKVMETILDCYDILGEKQVELNDYFMDKIDDLFDSIKLCCDDIGLIFEGLYHMAFDVDDVPYYRSEIIEFNDIHKEQAQNFICEIMNAIKEKSVSALDDYVDEKERPTLAEYLKHKKSGDDNAET